MEHTFTAAPHHDVLVVLVQLAVLLFTARMLGEIAQRFNQPTVVGEILAGIVLGPSFISGFFPAAAAWLVPKTPVQGHLLEFMSLIGVLFFLLVTGLEINLRIIQKQARSAIGIALGGLLLPLAMGFALGQVIPGNMLPDPSQRFVFALFIAIAMSISAIPVISKVLMDLKLTHRAIAQTVIASALIDDMAGWILLSIVIGLASGKTLTGLHVAQSVLTVVAFMALSLTVGRWCVSRLVHYVQHHLQMPDKTLTLMVLLMLVWGALGHVLHIEALIGAFTIGIVFAQIPQLQTDAVHQLRSISLGVFTPIFFAASGLKVNILGLLEPSLIILTFYVIGVAITCKMVGVYLGSRVIGRNDHWTSVFYGAGLNARGSMEIIVANIGYSLHILSQEMFSIIVLMAVITSIMSPTLMRMAIKHIPASTEDEQRVKVTNSSENLL